MVIRSTRRQNHFGSFPLVTSTIWYRKNLAQCETEHYFWIRFSSDQIVSNKSQKVVEQSLGFFFGHKKENCPHFLHLKAKSIHHPFAAC